MYSSLLYELAYTKTQRNLYEKEFQSTLTKISFNEFEKKNRATLTTNNLIKNSQNF